MTAEVRQLSFVRPPGATDILLVRHGESAPAREDAPFELVEGHGDPELEADVFEELNTFTAVVYLKKVTHPAPGTPAAEA